MANPLIDDAVKKIIGNLNNSAKSTTVASASAGTVNPTASKNAYVDEKGQTLNAPSYARGTPTTTTAAAKTTTTPAVTGTASGSTSAPAVGGGNVGAISTTFTPSETYLKAMQYTNSLLEQLSSGRTSYTDKINSLMDQIMNREKFSYDPNEDGLFQSMLAGYMRSGQVAMQDTIGQAAGLTGGYGSSYATSAANQAYNSYIQDAYAQLPDYYGIALDAYNQEGQNMYNQLGMYQDADATEYGRLANAYSANAQNAANIYDQEYNNFWQTQNFNQSERQFAAEMAYKNAQAARSQSNWEKEYALSLEKAKSAASASGNTSDISNAEWNSIFGEIDNFVNAHGTGKSTDALYATIANQYNMTEQDINYMMSHGDTTSKAYSNDTNYILDLTSGAYHDKSGNVVQNAHSTFSLYKAGSGGKSKADDAQYIDDYGNIVTYAKLVANGLKNRIK